MADITTDNILVSNKGLNPVPGFNFMLRVEGIFDLPCKSIRAFTREMEYELIQEGGLNDYVHMRRKPISKPFYLEVERYVGLDYIDPLPIGAELLLPVILMISRNVNQFIPMVSARTFLFTGCTVVKKTFGDMVADQSGLLVDTTTIAYREMICVDAPWSEAVGPSGEFTSRADSTNAMTVDELTQKSKEADDARKAEEDLRRVKKEETTDGTGEGGTEQTGAEGTSAQTTNEQPSTDEGASNQQNT